ncbi:MAG: hypothetical protein IJW55_05165 [Clostridia bacterium]|nr:hypothetical protein [Clostridia bacterium]
MKSKNILNENSVRLIKIGKEALFEFIYEKMIEDQKDPLSVANTFDMDWENGQFIFCVHRSEDKNGNFIEFPKEINLKSLMRNLSDTTTSMFQNNRYKEFTKEELIALSKK